MFFDKYAVLCKKKGVSVYKACTDLGLNRSAVAKWKAGATPNGTTIALMADYFGVSSDYLLYDEQQKEKPTLTEKDERDIARTLEAVMNDLDKGGDLMFDGDPMTDEARESIRAAMKLGLEAAKLKNKERFTPKKFRKE